MPPGSAPVEGKEAIRSFIGKLIMIPSFFVALHLESVNVSQSGDLAWVSYSCDLTVKDLNGYPIADKGKDISIYWKQSDGSWKLVVDMWSANQQSPSSS